MFDVNKFEEKQNKLNRYKEQIRVLEELKKDISENIICEQDKCEHELILCYSKEICVDDNMEIKKANCLICGAYLEFDGTFELFSETKFTSDKMIDITNKVNSYTFKNGENIYVLKAKEIINEIICLMKKNNKIYNLPLVRKTIYNSLINYDEKIKKERVKKLTK